MVCSRAKEILQMELRSLISWLWVNQKRLSWVGPNQMGPKKQKSWQQTHSWAWKKAQPCELCLQGSTGPASGPIRWGSAHIHWENTDLSSAPQGTGFCKQHSYILTPTKFYNYFLGLIFAPLNLQRCAQSHALYRFYRFPLWT